MSREFITLSRAAKRYGISELRIWVLIRNKKLRSGFTELKDITVDIRQLDKYVKRHPEELKEWRDAKNK